MASGTPPAPLPGSTELPPAVAPGPFSALFPTRFILDDSALYLSDKCEVETLDLRRGGQGLGCAPPTLRGQAPDTLRAARCHPAAGLFSATHACLCLHTCTQMY